MAEHTLTIADADQALQLFGPRDQFLRQLRDRLGVEIVLKGDQLRLLGPEDRLGRARDVVSWLLERLQTQGRLEAGDVTAALANAGEMPDDRRDAPSARPVTIELPAIDLFEKAKRVTPRTPGQSEYVQAVLQNELVFCIGPAGSGKTYLAVAMAVHALRLGQIQKIVLVRPAVEAGEELGFLPGDLLDKVKPFLRPLLDALYEMLGPEQVGRYMERDIIEIVPLAFMRGRTLNGTFMILDEAQNTTVTQMKMFLTRMGHDSRIVVTGDITQIDLPPNVTNGLIDAVERLQGINGLAIVRLSGRDIVRHRLVRDIVRAYDTGQYSEH